MISLQSTHALLDTADTAFGRDVLFGLSQPQKQVPCTWLYDHRGAELFEDITLLPEYYPTRAEVRILERSASLMAHFAGPQATLVEFGSGSSRKTPLLLSALESPAAYVPIDISAQVLLESVVGLQGRFPHIRMNPLVADFHKLKRLPGMKSAGRRLGFFPGSTVGNCGPEEAVDLLGKFARMLGPDALLAVGADATQDPRLLLPAYDDSRGVTAAFNHNLLWRINRELAGTFDDVGFRHEARYDAVRQRVEMHLVSRHAQRVQVLGHEFRFARGESIHTESSYKFGPIKFQALAKRAGWTPLALWMDDASRFTVYLFERSF
ncbi:L-histidine N(alpha)-methyltransferase [Piscinibacter sp. XHJ-5]|uniref:L-histidine N(alpha)-methyltransferase n=1 Tax=Piscinibacter sp. XHJ-5 TaxID=3037797 RepID=UPI0024528FCD|nr:L-histidine N(alpha)-methyltransferase [Piscinibacter sp. XHJ-5]